MSLRPDPLPQGAPYAIGELFFAALQGEPAFAGAKVINNPERRVDLNDGGRIVFLEDITDAPADLSAEFKRIYTFNLGVINRTAAARRSAHADYRAAKRAVRAAMPRLKGTVELNGLREGVVAYRLENIDIGGALVLGAFTLAYRDPGHPLGPF
ncbi:hypothetical protein BH11PSE13_BH11PSE13_12180 [soil metagenome]